MTCIYFNGEILSICMMLGSNGFLAVFKKYTAFSFRRL